MSRDIFNLDCIKINCRDCFFIDNEQITESVHDKFQEANSEVIRLNKELAKVKEDTLCKDKTIHNHTGVIKDFSDVLDKRNKELAKVKEMLKNHVQYSERYKAFIMTHCRKEHSATESELLNLLRKLHSGEMDSLIGIQKENKEGAEDGSI